VREEKCLKANGVARRNSSENSNVNNVKPAKYAGKGRNNGGINEMKQCVNINI